jgi:predicted GNAT family acetyltransferase
VEVDLVADPAEFLEAAGPLLLADEARHNLILGLAATVRDTAIYPGHRLWVVRDGGGVVGVAQRTPPYPLALARPRDPGAIGALVDAIDEELPGVVAAVPEAQDFADAWAARTGVGLRQRFAQGIYALSEVRPVSHASGRMRYATAADAGLMLDWHLAFEREAMHEAEPDEARAHRAVEIRIKASKQRGLALWEDGDVVSFAGYGGATPNGIRIGPVYTPLELRGRGYASALVAELSASLLAADRRFCFLYTDLANPTANKIYERIGYERVCDSAEIVFERA